MLQHQTLSHKADKPKISFVIPLFNEEACVLQIHERVSNFVKSFGIQYEMIFVNDGSTDNTMQLLRQLHDKDPRLKVVSFSRNFGHQIAVTAGLRYAKGDCVVVMDADLQDPPEAVQEMLAKWRQGYHVVYGIRRNRKEGLFKRACYAAFYRLQRKTSFLKIPLDAGDFCLMDRCVIDEMRKFNEDSPFVRGLRSWVGFKQTGIEYDRQARIADESKYSFQALFRLALDGMFSFSYLALRLATWFGLIITGLSMAYGVLITVLWFLVKFGLLNWEKGPPGWTSLIVGLFFLLGVQFIFIGILGEYVGRIFIQIKGRPLFVIEEELGFGDE
jgi:dolichol-phosphate mannosyltransferase